MQHVAQLGLSDMTTATGLENNHSCWQGPPPATGLLPASLPDHPVNQDALGKRERQGQVASPSHPSALSLGSRKRPGRDMDMDIEPRSSAAGPSVHPSPRPSWPRGPGQD